jgi:hypothetical protein
MSHPIRSGRYLCGDVLEIKRDTYKYLDLEEDVKI